jgi:hypothetical protein
MNNFLNPQGPLRKFDINFTGVDPNNLNISKPDSNKVKPDDNKKVIPNRQPVAKNLSDINSIKSSTNNKNVGKLNKAIFEVKQNNKKTTNKNLAKTNIVNLGYILKSINYADQLEKSILDFHLAFKPEANKATISKQDLSNTFELIKASWLIKGFRPISKMKQEVLLASIKNPQAKELVAQVHDHVNAKKHNLSNFEAVNIGKATLADVLAYEIVAGVANQENPLYTPSKIAFYDASNISGANLGNAHTFQALVKHYIDSASDSSTKLYKSIEHKLEKYTLNSDLKFLKQLKQNKKSTFNTEEETRLNEIILHAGRKITDMQGVSFSKKIKDTYKNFKDSLLSELKTISPKLHAKLSKELAKAPEEFLGYGGDELLAIVSIIKFGKYGLDEPQEDAIQILNKELDTLAHELNVISYQHGKYSEQPEMNGLSMVGSEANILDFYTKHVGSLGNESNVIDDLDKNVLQEKQRTGFRRQGLLFLDREHFINFLEPNKSKAFDNLLFNDQASNLKHLKDGSSNTSKLIKEINHTVELFRESPKDSLDAQTILNHLKPRITLSKLNFESERPDMLAYTTRLLDTHELFDNIDAILTKHLKQTKTQKLDFNSIKEEISQLKVNGDSNFTSSLDAELDNYLPERAQSLTFDSILSEVKAKKRPHETLEYIENTYASSEDSSSEGYTSEAFYNTSDRNYGKLELLDSDTDPVLRDIISKVIENVNLFIEPSKLIKHIRSKRDEAMSYKHQLVKQFPLENKINPQNALEWLELNEKYYQESISDSNLKAKPDFEIKNDIQDLFTPYENRVRNNLVTKLKQAYKETKTINISANEEHQHDLKPYIFNKDQKLTKARQTIKQANTEFTEQKNALNAMQSIITVDPVTQTSTGNNLAKFVECLQEDDNIIKRNLKIALEPANDIKPTIEFSNLNELKKNVESGSSIANFKQSVPKVNILGLENLNALNKELSLECADKVLKDLNEVVKNFYLENGFADYIKDTNGNENFLLPIALGNGKILAPIPNAIKVTTEAGETELQMLSQDEVTELSHKLTAQVNNFVTELDNTKLSEYFTTSQLESTKAKEKGNIYFNELVSPKYEYRKGIELTSVMKDIDHETSSHEYVELLMRQLERKTNESLARLKAEHESK